MKALIGLFHFVVFLLGATIKLKDVKYPNMLMLFNRIISTIFLMYLINKMI
jgi:hypothetical protein